MIDNILFLISIALALVLPPSLFVASKIKEENRRDSYFVCLEYDTRKNCECILDGCYEYKRPENSFVNVHCPEENFSR